MCGIFAYIGSKNNAASIVLDGLKRLEYRGYDSWGITVNTNNSLQTAKQVGAIGDSSVLVNLPESTIAIGHTRWATHGGVNQTNAHPHAATDDSFTLAQNGIVENYKELKSNLEKHGYNFKSQTDTEVIVYMIQEELKQAQTLLEAVQKAFNKLTGRNTIILLTKNGTVIAARNGSPLVIGKNNKTGEFFISSDTLSFAPYATHLHVVDNGNILELTDQKLTIYQLSNMKPIPLKLEPLKLTSSVIEKQGYDHFMIKEINEAPLVVRQLLKQDKTKYEELAEAIKKANHVYTIGSGTAGIAAAQLAYYLRAFSKIPATSLVGADAYEYFDLFQKGDIMIAPSQSGETADVLEVLELAKNKGVKIASFVNMEGSMMTKLSDFKFMADAGPEVCVMSTKIFTSQIAWGYLVAKTVAGQYKAGSSNLAVLANKIEAYLQDNQTHKSIKSMALKLKNAKDIFLMGKAQNFQIIREGMVKLIEGTYKHAHALPAGDLKHYAITLIEPGVPVIVAISDDEVKDDVLNAVEQVKTRGATVYGVSSDKTICDENIIVPETGETSAIMNVIPMQLLSYHMTVLLGNNVDKPRNIAKSVTVK